MIDLNKAIRKEYANSGTYFVWSRRDAPNRPLAGGAYMAAKTYDEFTADVLVEALRLKAQKDLNPPAAEGGHAQPSLQLGSGGGHTQPSPTSSVKKPQGLHATFEWPKALKAKKAAAKGRKKVLVSRPPKTLKMPEVSFKPKAKGKSV